jgi:hypothetical protein
MEFGKWSSQSAVQNMQSSLTKVGERLEKRARPSKFSTKQCHLFHDCIIDETPEMSYHRAVKITIVLVFILVDHVQVPHKQPRP